MPIYEYQCKSCNQKFEKMRPFSRASEPAECPSCRKSAERILSACITKSTTDSGISQNIGGSSCSSCSGGSCSSCGH